ncbi:MAG: bacteriohemerythrin [Alphaproteobacteria bacterium]|nr:bacteriohemerythrin [Alphaproteobacteria bacterium]
MEKVDLLKWSNNYSIGIPSIDAQHMKIIDMLNILHVGIMSKRSKAALEIVIRDLIAYAETHFKYEEDIFEKIKYPERSLHISEHEALRKRVSEFQKKFEEGNDGTIALQLLNFLREWLIRHIQKEDKEYSSFLIANGIK